MNSLQKVELRSLVNQIDECLNNLQKIGVARSDLFKARLCLSEIDIMLDKSIICEYREKRKEVYCV